jgi:uncharacterized membrane protein YvlD (DUF360 family)
MAIVLIKLGIRLVVFTAVFWIAVRKNEKVVVKPKWAVPVVATVFALLNVGLYWALRPILNLATLGAIGFVMPLVVNLVLLIATERLVAKKSWLKIDGIIATVWMAVILTVAHGVLWFGVDYLPHKF